MKSWAVFSVGLCYLLLVGAICAQQSAYDVARTFLPPQGEMAELVTYDPSTGEPIERRPAVLMGQIASSDVKDIVFAYYTRVADLGWKSLFVAILHKTDSGYVKLSEVVYPNRVLWVQEFATNGLNVLRLPGRDTDSISMITSSGASLGGQLEIFNWDSDWGLKNVMPGNTSVRHFGFKENKESLTITLSFERYPGEEGVPPPIVYKWCGDEFVKSN